MDSSDNNTGASNEDRRYRLLVDSITDYAIYMLDPGGKVQSWNRGARKLKGYEEAEIIGEHFSRFYTEEDRQAGLPARTLATAAKEGRFEAEEWRVRKDGSRFWTQIVVDPIRGDSGELIGYAKITKDLTERKAAEDTLKQSEQQFRMLVEGVTDYAIYMLDPNGYVVSWNLGAQRIKGYLSEEIIGEHFSRFYTEEDRALGAPQRNLEIAIREGRFENEGWRIRKDGSRFCASIVIDPIRNDTGDLVGFAKVTRDVTERRESQHALEGTREALFQAQKLEAIGQLTGGVAHDFNNLLMVVLGSLELLRKRLPDDPKATTLLDNAIQGAKRGASLTQRMLAFARRQDLDPRPTDLPDLVRGMSDLLQRSLGPTVNIETRFPLALPLVRSDANQLEAALLNLAVNARDAMSAGGSIIIAAREQIVTEQEAGGLSPGRYVCFSVRDHGEGMDENTMARAAEPFFTTKGVGKGTGLGLSMVQGLAEQSGGRLVLSSKKGIGTTVEIWLPVANQVSDTVEEEMNAAERKSNEQRHLTVLAVDDDALVLMNTAAMLEDLGHTAIEAISGEKALEALRQEGHVDLVITDQAMPRMTGVQLAEIINKDWPQLPVILATGYAELPQGLSSDLPRLPKPFDQQQLSDAVAEATRKRTAMSRVLDFSCRTRAGKV